ncbi:CpaB family protein [Agromyces marinus]|uniref:hypothetical protein n=1 Tax=Agromyces marinus TaxID=1389020 RepID=UPI001F24CEB6|nr:hypothetical protein [Agromyces marinus]UIP58086.1 hypothetical protein DSM26151_09560 [Agromyces marinus]
MAERTARVPGGRRRLDPRLVLGLVLIAGSTIGVWALVAAADDTTRVLVAPSTISAGTRIEPGALRTEPVRLGALADGYLVPGDVPEGGLVVIRTVRAGELVPAASVAEADTARRATVVIPTRGALAREIRPGAIVDVWTASELERGVYEPPVVLISGAEVAAVLEDDAMVATGGPSVEVLIPRDKTAAMLEALAAGDVVDLVPADAAGAD